jgi:hypothetical protein
MIPDDPVIQRIRDARRQLQAECGDDLHKMLLWAMEEQKKYADQLVHWEHPDEVLDFATTPKVKP